MEKVVVQTGAKTYQITDQDGNDQVCPEDTAFCITSSSP